jgi:hypothetical protein
MLMIQEVHRLVEIAINVAAVVQDLETDAVNDRADAVVVTHYHAVHDVGDLPGIVRIVNKRGSVVKEDCLK